MNVNQYFEEHRKLRDILGIVVFIAAVLIGSWLINLLLFRSFSVYGGSMETTLYTGDRLIVNRLPVTIAELQFKTYVPPRGQIIVFKNPLFDQPSYSTSASDEYIVKRVIGLPGERVVLKDGKYTVYNSEHPNGFDPDALTPNGPSSPTDGEVDTTVPQGQIFVSGDHRQAGFSLDSRNGLGTIPLNDVVGPVGLRIYPFNKMRTF